jgi:diguanylate cyclase (GGDEF)-like protein
LVIARLKNVTKSRPKSRLKTASGGPAAAKLGPPPSPGRAGARDGGKPSRKAASRPEGAPRSPAAEIRRLTAELAKARGRIRELESLAETDALLGILNRRGFERGLKRGIAYIQRYRGTGAVLALDVDRLKRVNDESGHAAGDALLKAIAGFLQRQIRASDLVGRLGGDEFAVVLWNLSEADALAKAASLEAGIDGLVTTYRGRSIAAGASTGVAIIAADDDAASVLERADKAMYARKRQRRR